MTFEVSLDRDEGIQQVVLESIQSSRKEMNEDTGGPGVLEYPVAAGKPR